jgi:electron transport complex protein RnfC
MMIKKSFFGLAKPRLEYQSLTGVAPEPKVIPPPEQATFLLEGPFKERDPELFNEGDSVKVGQKISHSRDGAYALSTVSGTIASVAPFTGDFGQVYTMVDVDAQAQGNESVDDAFGRQSNVPSLELALDYLAELPGAPPLTQFTDPDKPIHTIVIYGGDTDLLISTNQYIVKSRIDDLKNGIDALKTVSGVDKVVLAIPGEMMQGYGHLGAEVKKVDTAYPSAFPHKIMEKVIGRAWLAGQSAQDLGVCFIKAEAVASLGKAFEEGRPPTRKLLTVVDKSLNQTLVSAVLGTPIGNILDSLGIRLNDKDRIILGGPMTGSAIYTTAYPVRPETDALMVQDHNDIAEVSDYPCINCGECVRICPVRIPVNMLVRFLEAGQYEAGADQYDLHACIDCGLCSFVCVSKIPIFQYIRLAKYELERMKAAEAENE